MVYLSSANVCSSINTRFFIMVITSTKEESTSQIFEGVSSKSYALELLIITFLGSLFYTINTRGGGGAIFRIGYSFFLYSAIILIAKVFFSNANRDKLLNDRKCKFFFGLVILFAIFNSIKDFYNPDFSAVTLFNNSRGVVSVLPIFAFIIGFNTNELKGIERFVMAITVAFIAHAFYTFVNEPSAPKVFTCVVLPFAVFNLTKGKYKILTIVVFAVAIWHSVLIDYRALLLRVIIFAGFFVTLNVFKKSSIVKFLIVAAACFIVYISLTNLGDFLELFQSDIRLSDSMDNDTRTFLYTELFDDLKPGEAILGRGFLGTYFSQVFLGFQSMAENADADSYMRFSIEVGILQLILKGGYIFAFLFLAPIIYTTWKGLNLKETSLKLEYNICIYLLTELLIFFFENSPSFHIHFFLLFFFAGYVYNKIKRSGMDDPALPV